MIRSTQTAAGNEQVSLTFHLDRSGSENFISDASYVFQNYGSDLDFNSVQYPGHINETSRLAYKVLGNGQMVFSGSGETGGITNVLPYCGYNGGDDLRFLGSSRFFCNVQIGSVADVEEKLLSIPATGLTLNTEHMNPGGWTNWSWLTGSALVNDGSIARFKLPETPDDGFEFSIYNASGDINLHTGATNDRKFHSSSFGTASDYQVNISTVGRWKAIYISSTNRWLLL